MNVYPFKKAGEYFNPRAPALFFSALIFVLCIAVSEFLVSAEYDKENVDAKIAAAEYANTLNGKISRRLNAVIFVTSGLSSYLTVYHQELNAEKIQAMLADLYAKTKNVRNFAVAVNYKITYIYPLQSNEKALGIDYRNLPEHWPQVEQAIENRQGVIAGPVGLLQGGNGIIYRLPIFVNDEYWGILSTVINTESFLNDAFDNMADDEYIFAIRLKDSREVFYGDPELFDHKKSIITSADFPGVKWEWAVFPKTETSARLILVTRVLGVVISLLLASLAYFFFKERKALTSQAMQDSLTGLANRRQLDFKLLEILAQTKRFKHNIAIMFIDVDYFKKLNDTYGHDVGDELLKVVATKLQDCIRDVDLLARVGGDEFVLLLNELKDPADAKLVAKKIIALFDDELIILGTGIKVTLSIGVANNTHSKDETVKSLLKKADTALYAAKAAGRNGYQIYDDVE